jgi:hypothetical protein
MSRDVAINQALISSKLNWGVSIYNIVSANPLEITLNILAIKLGITNKIIISVIVAFLI